MEEGILILIRIIKKYSERWTADDVNLIINTMELWLDLNGTKNRDASEEEALKSVTRSVQNCARAFEWTVIKEVAEYATIENAIKLLGL